MGREIPEGALEGGEIMHALGAWFVNGIYGFAAVCGFAASAFVCVFVAGIIYTILGRVFGDSGDDE